MTNQEIAQLISERIGPRPVPFEAVRALALEIYHDLGGEEADENFEDIFEILLSIIPLAEGGVKTYYAGQNISINASNNISALGYIFDSTNGGFAEKYKQDNSDGGQIVANTATGLGAHAEGYKTIASGDYGSHAEGNATQATGYVAHAEGYKTTASGNFAHSEGYQTIASGDYSHVEGGRVKRGNNYFYTTASGSKAHAEGEATSAEGAASHTEGAETQALNAGEHAEGVLNLSHKVSNDTRDAGNTRHSVGIGWFYKSTPDTLYRTNAVEIMANGDQYIIGVGGYDGVHIKNEDPSINVQTVQEYFTSLETAIASKQNELTSGQNINIDSSNRINVEGYIFDKTKHAFRTDADTVNGSGANVATGINSFSCGDKSTASGDYGSFATGSETVASGWCSFAEGNATTASGVASHAEGGYTTASGDYSHAEGVDCVASGTESHAEGWNAQALGDITHVEGYNTIGYAGHVEGYWNISDNTQTTVGSKIYPSRYIHIAGNGYTNNRSNAYTLGLNGKGWYQSDVLCGGSSEDAPLHRLSNKQDVLTAGTNITISGTTISATYQTATTADIEALFA